MYSRLNIFCGHFGSGKTEVSLNYAVKLANEGKKVTIIDMDNVNPYFRTADARDILAKYGIELIASEFASSNLDMPVVPYEVKKVFCDTSRTVIFDVGGDDDGAFILGQFNSQLVQEGYKMTLVVSTRRPLTTSCDELYDIATRIERASRLKFTDIANNTNVGKLTTPDILLSGYDEIKKLSEMLDIPVSMQCGIASALEQLPPEFEKDKFPMTIYLKMPWEL